MSAVLTEIVINCIDPEAVGRFWSEVLDWQLKTEEGYWWSSQSGDETTRPLLVFIAVPEPKTGRNRLHIDVSPSGCSQAEELQRLLGLGATQIDVGQGEVSWIVLADPEGNEFCLLSGASG